MFPVFARARENARRSSCQSNLKQLALGIRQYIQDYDERYPWCYWSTSTPVDKAIWEDAIQPYVKSTQLLSCPSSSNPFASGIPHYGDGNGTRVRDYGINYALTQAMQNNVMQNWGGVLPVASNKGPVSEAEIQEPVRTTLLGDSDFLFFVNHRQVADTSPDNVRKKLGFFPRHLEGANIAFADGHVKWLKNLSTNYIWNPRDPAGTNGMGQVDK